MQEGDNTVVDIGWLAQNGPCERYAAGQTIPCPGGADGSERAMYILLVGRVDVTGAGRKPSPGISLFPGDVFGGSEYFTDKVECVYTAAFDSVVYVINETSFHDLSWSQPDIVLAVMKAAYIPQGKPTNQVKTMQEKAANAASAKAKTMQGAAMVQGAAKAQEEKAAQEAKAAAPGTSAAAAVASAQQADRQAPPEGMPAAGTFFPEGHKHYPGITKPTYMRLVYPKDYTCPVCKKTFKDYRIFASKLYESAPMRYDMRRFYTDFQPEWYDVITCRYCYFSAVHSCYTESRPVLKQKIENELAAARASILLDFDAERDIDFVFTSHYLALLCADGYLSFAVPLRAKLWGNLSWLYEDVGDEEMELLAAEKAAVAYEEVYTGTRLTPVQEQTTCLSIAGMQRRAGIDRNIKKFLYQVKIAKMGDKVYVKMAEDIMEEMRIK